MVLKNLMYGSGKAGSDARLSFHSKSLISNTIIYVGFDDCQGGASLLPSASIGKGMFIFIYLGTTFICPFELGIGDIVDEKFNYET